MRAVVVALVLLALIVFVGPLVVPIPPPPDTVPVRELADPDSRFLTVEGIDLHYKEQGEGEPVMLLLHGFGASTFSWREVMAPLARHGRVIAVDAPGFGLTERPLPGTWQERNPYARETQADLMVALMDALGIDRAIVFGHSAGGATALFVAARHPERVTALVLAAPAAYTAGPPSWVRPLVRLPQIRRLGPLLVRQIARYSEQALASAWHDPDRITPEVLEGYRRPLRAEHWDVGLWQLTLAAGPPLPEGAVADLRLPVLVVTGAEDTFVPAADSERLAAEAPDSEFVVIDECGHVPQEECPRQFLAAVEAFFAERGLAAAP